MSALKDMGEAIERAIEECHVSDVLSMLASALVGLTVELVRRQGEDTNKPITIDGEAVRAITIHPPKRTDDIQAAKGETNE